MSFRWLSPCAGSAACCNPVTTAQRTRNWNRWWPQIPLTWKACGCSLAPSKPWATSGKRSPCYGAASKSTLVSTPTLTTLAELLLLAGRSAEAVPLLQRAIQGGPPHPRAALLLARHYLDTGQSASALEVATPWCNSGKADVDLSALHVAAYAALGRQGEAVAYYRRLVARAPDNPVATHTLAVALNAAQQPAGSRARRASDAVRTVDRRRRYITRMLAASSVWSDSTKPSSPCANASDWIRAVPRPTTGWRSSSGCAPAISSRRRGSRDRALEKFPHDDALRGTKAALLQGAGDARGALRASPSAPHDPSPTPICSSARDWRRWSLNRPPPWHSQNTPYARRPNNHTARKLLCAAYLGVGEGGQGADRVRHLLQRHARRSVPHRHADDCTAAVERSPLRVVLRLRRDGSVDAHRSASGVA